MRDIKFRVYDESRMKYPEEYKESRFDNYFIDLNGELRYYQNCYDGVFFDTENAKIMQFTGLHDKKGKEIYEGDIISNGYEKCIVVWVKEYAGFMLKLINKEYEDKEWTNPMIDLRKDEEVIGNIYENNDLLKGADNIE